MGEEFTVMLLCFLKESSANDGITWTNIEYAEDLRSIHVDLRYYLQMPQPDNMGFRYYIGIFPSSRTATLPLLIACSRRLNLTPKAAKNFNIRSHFQ